MLPLVGIVIGAIAGTLGMLASGVMPLTLAVAIAFAASIVLSGAIHLDGYLDCCDALFASVPPERRFEILKDPRHGTYALAGLAIVVPAWLAAPAAIPPQAWPWAFAFCAGTARAAAVCNALLVPYGPGGASSRAFEERPNIVLLGACTLAALACAWPHPWLALLAVPALAGALAIGAWCARRLGGVLVGDCYGAVIVMVEVFLLAMVAVAFSRPRI